MRVFLIILCSFTAFTLIQASTSLISFYDALKSDNIVRVMEEPVESFLRPFSIDQDRSGLLKYPIHVAVESCSSKVVHYMLFMKNNLPSVPDPSNKSNAERLIQDTSDVLLFNTDLYEQRDLRGWRAIEYSVIKCPSSSMLIFSQHFPDIVKVDIAEIIYLIKHTMNPDLSKDHSSDFLCKILKKIFYEISADNEVTKMTGMARQVINTIISEYLKWEDCDSTQSVYFFEQVMKPFRDGHVDLIDLDALLNNATKHQCSTIFDNKIIEGLMNDEINSGLIKKHFIKSYQNGLVDMTNALLKYVEKLDIRIVDDAYEYLRKIVISNNNNDDDNDNNNNCNINHVVILTHFILFRYSRRAEYPEYYDDHLVKLSDVFKDGLEFIDQNGEVNTINFIRQGEESILRIRGDLLELSKEFIVPFPLFVSFRWQDNLYDLQLIAKETFWSQFTVGSNTYTPVHLIAGYNNRALTARHLADSLSQKPGVIEFVLSSSCQASSFTKSEFVKIHLRIVQEMKSNVQKYGKYLQRYDPVKIILDLIEDEDIISYSIIWNMFLYLNDKESFLKILEKSFSLKRYSFALKLVKYIQSKGIALPTSFIFNAFSKITTTEGEIVMDMDKDDDGSLLLFYFLTFLIDKNQKISFDDFGMSSLDDLNVLLLRNVQSNPKFYLPLLLKVWANSEHLHVDMNISNIDGGEDCSSSNCSNCSNCSILAFMLKSYNFNLVSFLLPHLLKHPDYTIGEGDRKLVANLQQTLLLMKTKMD